MKITRKKTFDPIKITLETKAERDALKFVVNEALDKRRGMLSQIEEDTIRAIRNFLNEDVLEHDGVQETGGFWGEENKSGIHGLDESE